VSTDPRGQPQEPHARPGNTPGQPSEEELRAAYEAELSRITSADMMLQAAVSLLSIGSRRLGRSQPAAGSGAPEGAERDLEQARDAIDAVRALLEILERRMPKELGALREALSQLQMAYAREVRASGGEPQPGASEAHASERDAPPGGAAAEQQGQAKPSEQGDSPAEGERPEGPGPAEASGRLWVPGR
jgi:hypothetical protein